MANRVYVVEKFVYRVLHEGFEPSEEEVRSVGELLGQPTKKLSVVLDRYKQVFGRYVEKRCAGFDHEKLCLYTWSQKVPFKAFPLSMHLTGTIILFKDDKPVEVVAYPIPKALSYAKSSDVSEEKFGFVTPREVSKRVDGWQITAYYNPLLGKWVFATRYVLHNMYFDRGKLVSEPFESIANPYVYVAHRIAEEENLYSVLDKFRGWTITFVLEGPEPAVTKPPYPLGDDYRRYKLYALMARDPSGKLYTWRETGELLNYRVPESVEPKKLSDLYRDVSRKLDVRSYFAYVDTGDLENPLIIELESDAYPEAMNVKYLNNAKSAAILVVDGLGHELKKIVDQRIASAIDGVEAAVESTRKLLQNLREDMYSSAAWEIARTVTEFREDADIKTGELEKALKEGNVDRVVKKVLAILLENKSLTTIDTLEMLSQFVDALRKRIESLTRENIEQIR